VRPEHLAGGSPRENADTVRAVLSGEASSGATAAVVLNAAAAIYVSGSVRTFDDAVNAAAASVESGAGLAALERLRNAFRTESAA
jgi:anthranilate phosphoribosyltransferase